MMVIDIMTVKFQIVSDLHIEYENDGLVDPLDYITPSAEVLILAGDIGSLYKMDQLKDFIRKVSQMFKYTIYVLGNHEFYKPPKSPWLGLTHGCLLDRAMSLEKSIPRLSVLHRQSVRFGDVCVIGATLWSNLECDLPRFIVQIDGMTSEKYNSLHLQDKAYIDKMIKYCEKEKLKTVVVTHHPPSYSVMKNARKRARFLSLYATHMDDFLDRVDTWICGHVHVNFDITTDSGSRLVGNQRGKPKDNINDYNKQFTIKY